MAALIVAIIGTFLLITYVNGAESRAFAGTETREVYVVQTAVAANTPAASLGNAVTKKSLPAAALPEGALTDLNDLQGKVAAVALEPGEVLLASRFASPDQVEGKGRVAVPEGMQEVTVKLPIERVVGGTLSAGDTVGVFFSLGDGANGAQTQLTFHKVLVTGVQLASGEAASNNASSPQENASGGGLKSSGAAGTGEYLVTLARPAAEAERIVFATEFGSLYLSKEPSKAIENNEGVVDRTKVFR
ncbi:Flp pilus assembly protein CpaB [Sinomonas mesophila]|uniref:Flp pilus assembly protein CpaB n=1 Tax=Sinomonas mesophila TaxID=1531955 RepID=UPI001FE94610|nr:RcpC/CpaB family pilus assembly protein [Sinomonas mesophila]